MNDISRREFLVSAAASAAGAALLGMPQDEATKKQEDFVKRPDEKVPIKASRLDKVRFAGIGIGGQGGSDIDAVVGEGGQLVALCDVDQNYAAKKFKQYPDAKPFVDFREMLDQMDKEIDAVVIGTPDHTHALIAIEAMKRGKHVYCEKPLTHTIGELRAVVNAAKKYGVVTQLGNQGHSTDTIRRTCEWIWAGAIGKVHTIHAACGEFPQVYCQIPNLEKAKQKYEVPAGLDYERWVGPAQWRDYTPLWVPWNWRGWMNFGTGTIGDWICHVVDPSFWALDLGAPASVRAEVMDYDPKTQGETYPPGSAITFEFPAKGERGPVKLVWHDGKNPIPRPEKDFPEDEFIPRTGAIILGEKGLIRHGSHGAGGCRLFPDSVREAYGSTTATPPKIERVKGHQWDWLEAIKNGRQAGSNFDYGARLTQIALIGAIALRFPGETLQWDDRRARFTNHREANQYVNPPARKGWELAS